MQKGVVIISLHVYVITCFVFAGQSLYCYRCNSNYPGCGTPLNWLWFWGEVCPEYDDKCIKIIERKGGMCCVVNTLHINSKEW